MGNICHKQFLRNEFRKENFSLNFENNSQFLSKDPEDVLEYFHSSIWSCCNKFVYLIYRTVIAVYYTIWFFESIFRNAEYRSQNFMITNKQKTNVLHLHPWPFYMTSWSLTILFIHLWLSDFIVLYFYSVSKKSIIYSIFAFLCGPFSCSKVKESESSKTSSQSRTLIPKTKKSTSQHISKSNYTDSNEFIIKTKNAPSVRFDRDREIFAQTYNLSEIDVPCVNSAEKSLITKNNDIDNTSKCVTIIVNEILLETNIRSSEVLDTSSQTNENATTQTEAKETYCVKKSACECPSSLASDATSRSEWIKTHVPSFILFLIKISWLLYNQIVISAFVVTVGYFTYVFINELETEPTVFSEIGNFHRHGINSIVVIIDIILLGYPVRILHFVYTLAYGWSYALVTFFFWLNDPKKNIIYKEIDYSRPMTILGYYLALSLMTFLLQVVHFLAYRLKLFLRYECRVIQKTALK